MKKVKSIEEINPAELMFFYLSLIDQRNNLIVRLSNILKKNNTLTEKKSLELIKDIFKINSLLKSEDDKLLLKALTEYE